ncbi:uncharacterized protein ATNIH1004_006478 [Aspergillus tanneri]|uniref:Major facilitator superfamily (MFS) profile domain-containing protein n=1 Tax=Aspergillus tanneri TaxID=1220188 RepID=A0A5M9MZF5_9EURO|nr:uncharacterized protein ATNIH1004_006478 [Aspergillus tanneri]KAA8647777.1 hypothetical protein ATNIH1004_006478 [Aspergillus tanneri]
MSLHGRSLLLAQNILVAFPSFILFGYNQAGVVGLLAFNSWTHTILEIDTTHSKSDATSNNSIIQGVYVSSTLGALVGAFSCSALGDWLGRRKTIFIGAWLTLGRTSPVPPYRNLFLNVPQQSTAEPTLLSTGSVSPAAMLTSWINYGISHIEESSSWRVLLAIPCPFSIVLIVSVFFFPGSTRRLIRTGRRDAAANALARDRKTTPDDPNIRQGVATIELLLEEAAEQPRP